MACRVRTSSPYSAGCRSRSPVVRATISTTQAASPRRSSFSRTAANGWVTSKRSTRTRSLWPVSKNTSWPSVNSSRLPPKRDRIRRAARATPRTRPKSREKNVTTRSLSPSGKLPITTAADRPRPTSGHQPEAELAQRALVLPPVAAHIDAKVEKYLDAEERFEPPPRLAADALEHGDR